ncbi:MAG: hypothetical protein RBR52_06880 [Thiomonas sp.]|uniref:hypothetical protein n=1 Tax=Thiomonas sp. TaxID=2047785 RepID=UPI002A36E225|nr:hypothetical protein [Thiomonas sp.]MDY0330203.1 hypothetical protein [Thiomonas sp.]
MYKLLTFTACLTLAPTVWASQPSCDDTEAGVCTNYLDLPAGLHEATQSNCANIGGKWSEQSCKQKAPTCRHAPMEYMGKKVFVDSIYYKDASMLGMVCDALGGKVIKN